VLSSRKPQIQLRSWLNVSKLSLGVNKENIVSGELKKME